MKTLYAHVGLPRCASTLIENLFLIDGAFDKFGINPYRHFIAQGMTPLTRMYKITRREAGKVEWGDEIFNLINDYILTPARRSEMDRFFFSDEALTEIGETGDAPLIYPSRADFLGRLFEGFDVRVILVVRQQATYLMSRYGLHLQNGGRSGLIEYIDCYDTSRLDWLKIANRFADVFGESNIRVVPFEGSLYDDVEATDFLDYLQTEMQVADKIGLASLPLVNPSVPPEYFETQLRVNRGELLPEAMPDAMTQRQQRQRDFRFSAAVTDRLMRIQESFAESNAELFRRYMPEFNASHYLKV